MLLASSAPNQRRLDFARRSTATSAGWVVREEAIMMGFKPLVYGNMKGFLNHHPTPEEMAYWAGKQGISIAQTTSFTDGTKIQIEQALIANCFGATITRQGMEGPKATDVTKAAIDLARTAAELGQAI